MIFLSPTVQHALGVSHTVNLCVSSILNLISLFCLIYETPPNQTQIRRYLLLTQVMVIVNMVYMDVLFQPIPLFPALAGMCTGILCTIGIAPHIVFGGLFITYAWLALSIFLCCIFRHQTLLPEGEKFGKTKRILLQIASFLVMGVPSVCYAAFPFDTTQTARRLIESPYNLGWALDRGPCFIHERTPIVVVFMSSVVGMLSATLFLFLFIFFHMLKVTVMSMQTIQKIRRSLLVLFIQLVVPICMLLIPGTVLFIAVLCECIPFEVNLIIFLLLPMHPIAHNLILLGITPTYQRLMLSVPRRIRKVAQFSKVHTQPNSVAYMIPKDVQRQR